MEEIRIVLQQGTKAKKEDSSQGSTSTISTTSSTSSTEQLILQTDKRESSDPPSPSTISPVPTDITLRPAAVAEGTEESSDSDDTELKKIRIVLDVNDGSNLTESSNTVNTDDQQIKLAQ